jgi:uncharacterized membrane protein YdjX (TVP38/TMEM64 family)
MKPTIDAMGANPSASRPTPRALGLRLAVGACCLGSLLLGAVFLTPQLEIARFALWARGAGAGGVAAFALAHVACALLLVPSWPVRIAAGFVYGAAWGLAVALLSSFAGSLLAFAAGRRLLRDRLAPRIARDPRLAAIDAAIAERGAWVVFLLRLSPVVPSELVNYALGASRVRASQFAWATFAGLVPLTASFAWLGSLLHAASDLAAGDVPTDGTTRLLWWIGVAATVALAAGAARLARRALGRSIPAAPAPAAAPAGALANG